MNFAHLHQHSCGSLLDGLSKVEDIAKRTVELGMSHAGLTDHGVLYSAPQFAEECEKAGVHACIGVELYLAPGHRSLRQEVDGERYFHLLALAENETGYRNLCKLVSRSYTEGFYHKNRTDLELLAEHREGLIVTSACLGGPLAARIMKDRIPQAKRAAEELKGIFGPDCFLVELQDHGLDKQADVNWHLHTIAGELGLQTVGTNDCHYVRARDAEPHEVLLCVQTGKTWSDPKRMKYGPAAFYLKSPEEMYQTGLTAYPGCLERTVEIAERCQFKFPKGQMHVPNFTVPEGHTAESWLEKLCRDAIPAKYPAHDERLEQRLTYELGLIQRKGYSTYFLIVHDIVSYAQGAGIMSQARGSAAGSVVSYLLGLSVVDPLRYNLLFDRFLNENRKSMPDIDIDFADRRREEVFGYCRTKYGEENVARIVAFSTMAARAAIKDAGRVLEYSGQEVGAITRLISPKPNTTIVGSIESTSELREAYEADPKVKRLIDTAKGLEGLHRQASVHAAGLVITPEPVSNFAPVQIMNDGAAIQYDMEYAEKIGLLKIDCLALRNLTVVNDCLRFIEEKEHRKLTLPEIPHDDAETYALLQRGETCGVFQFHDVGITRVVRGIHPERLEDLIAAVALYRPGPLESGMVRSYIDRKHGREKVTYEHDLLEPILKSTYGMIVYQEQVMQITMALAGFTPGGAEAAMKGMGKKKKEVIEALEKDFREGCAGNHIPAELASRIFEVMVNFSGYAFNMAHSAAYALLGYHTAYLKCHYPVEFMAASISSLSDKRDRLTQYALEARRMGIPILAPSVQYSEENCYPEAGAICLGLNAIKGVNEAGAGAIVTARRANGRFNSLGDFAARVGHTEPLSKASYLAMVAAGALDAFGDRAGLLSVAEKVTAQMLGLSKGKAAGQGSLFEGSPAIETGIEVPVVPPLPETERLGGERETLGFYLSKHPVLEAESLLRKAGCTFSADLSEFEHDSRVTVGGMVQKVTDKRTKAGQPMSVVELDDPTGTVSVIIFVQIHAQLRPLCEPGKLLVVNGTVSVKEGEEGSAEIDIKANEVREMEMPKETGPGTLILRFDTAVPPGVLSSLRGAFGSGLTGGCRVILETGAIRIDTDVRVDPDSLFAKRAVHLVGREGGTAEFV